MASAPEHLGHSLLPVSLTRFIGRERELALATERLRESRLVTLVGPGGIGKTRLAIEAARAWSDAHPADTWFVDLSAVSDEVGVERAVALAVGVADDGKTNLAQRVLEYLGEGSGLVVLDNCEQVIDAAAAHASQLLRACPDVRILATSREPLGIAGESLLEVPPLDIDTEALSLFEDRARAVAASPQPDAHPELAREICRRLDGMPLAIELAAARTRALSLSEINARLGDRFALLTTGNRTLPERHRTLGAAVDWSYQLLPPGEATLYARLSTFAGGWTLAAAEEVCSGEGIERADVIDLLTHLLDRSLVFRDSTAEPVRYRMLETIRAHAASRLEDREAWERRHFDWALATALEAETGMRGPAQVEWLERLSQERDNVRAALAWSASREELAEERLQLATALVYFWWFRGPVAEGLDWIRQFMAGRSSASATSVRALLVLGRLHTAIGELAAARSELDEAIEGARTLANEFLLGRATMYLAGLVALQSGDGSEESAALLEECRPLLERAGDGYSLAEFAMFATWSRKTIDRDWNADLQLVRRVGDRLLLGAFLNSLGESARENGDVASARRYYQAAIDERQALGGWGATRSVASVLNLGYVALSEGSLREAGSVLRACLGEAVEFKTLFGTGGVLAATGILAAMQHEPVRAARLFGASAALYDAMRYSPPAVDAAANESGVALARHALGDAEYGRHHQAGRALALDAAIQEAVELLDRVTADSEAEPPLARPRGLSRQETEVLRLLASGNTNREIAATLVLSVRTVETHIANAYNKIGARGRAEATAWAIANRIVTVGE